jgi:hypothetical protein
MVKFESNKFLKKMKFYFFLDIDKNGYIDQSEIDIMAKVFFIQKKYLIKIHFYLLLVCITNVRWKWK